MVIKKSVFNFAPSVRLVPKSTCVYCTLYLSWAAPHFVNAAELFIHLPGSGWKAEDIATFKELASSYKGKKKDYTFKLKAMNETVASVDDLRDILEKI